MFTITALLFCLFLDMDLSDLLFLLLLLSRGGFMGLRELIYLSVMREWFLGIWVLFYLTISVRKSISFSKTILFFLQSFSNWLRLKETSLILSFSCFYDALLALSKEVELINFTQISIFLLISSRNLYSISSANEFYTDDSYFNPLN